MPSRPFRPLRCAAVATLLLPLLAACGGGGNEAKIAPACPQLSLLHDAADLTRFAGPPGTPQDARGLILAAQITAVPATCAAAGEGRVRARLQVQALLRRGPAAQSDSVAVPYFIAITDQGNVLSEEDHTLAAKFRPNVDEMRTNADRVELLLPVTKAKSAAAYHLYVGFRLTPEELAYNRQSAGLP